MSTGWCSDVAGARSAIIDQQAGRGRIEQQEAREKLARFCTDAAKQGHARVPIIRKGTKTLR